jgi:hypothetical protein
MRWNRFRVCSACHEISSQYAQCAIKFVPRMLSMIVHVKIFAFYRWLSMRGNSFLVCSACDEIGSAYAQHAIKSFPRMLSICMLLFTKMTQKSLIKMQISPIKNLGTHLIGPQWRFWNKKYLDISQKKSGSAFAQSPRKCSNIEILAKILGKEAKFFSKIYEGHIRIWFRSKKKFKTISCLCTFNWSSTFSLSLFFWLQQFISKGYTVER